MANSFEEFLKQTPTAGTPTASVAMPGSFQEFLNKGAVAKPPEPQKSFFEREGLIQTILKPVINLGKDIAQFTPQYQEMQKGVQESQNLIAEKLKSADINDRTKQIIANINDNQEPFKEILNPRTPEQILGDVAGTALLVATPASLLRGIGTGIAAQATRGAVTGGLIGGAMGLSEKGTPAEILKSIAIGAGLGTVTEPLIGIAGQVAIKGVIKAAKVIKPIVSKFSETEAMKVISSVGTRLQQFGDDGREIVQRMLNADRNRLQRTGQFMNEAEQSGMFALNQEQRWSGKNSLLDRLEGRATNEGDQIGQAFSVADKMRTEIAGEAQVKGVQVRLQKGVSKPFQPRENYFPHMGVSADDITDNTQVFKDAVENAVRLGKFADEKEAQQVANAYREFVETNGRGGQFWTKWLVKDGQTSIGKLSEQEQNLLRVLEKRIPPPKGLEYPQEMVTKLRNAIDEAQGMTLRYFKQSRLPKFGQLEYSREVNFPFYDPDPIRVLPKYVAGATKRLEEIASFGVKGEELNKLIGRIRRVQGPEAGFEVADLVKAMTDTVKALPKVEKAAAFVRVLSVPKLAFSQIVNIGQSVNSLLASDIPSFARGFSAAFKEAGVQNALKSGSTLESVINEITTRAGESNFSAKFLRYTGFSATEKFNRTVSANVGMNWAAKNFTKLLANPTDKIAIGRLEELGINVSKALQAGKLTEDELLKAAQIFTERTQFRARPIDLPRFASSAYGKIFFQFKSFAFNQTKFLKDEFKRELQSGNYGRAVRDIIIIATIFPMTGEVLGDIKSLVTGSKRPTGALERYFDDLANVGGVGIAYDLFQSAANNKLASMLLGPTISSGIDITQLAIQAAKTGKLTDSQKKTIINQLGITRPIGNYVYSKDTKGYETFFETLKDFLNE